MELTVPEEAAGMRLDRFLSQPLGSRAQAQSAIDAGQVLVDGLARPQRPAVKAGELVTVAPRPAPAVADGEPTAPYAVAYEDEHLLVVDKPAGVVVHPARGHRSGTLAQA